MDNIIYKVAQRGEGKTKWLVEQAKNELDSGELVLYLSPYSRNYTLFLNYYTSVFKEVCKIEHIKDINNVPEGSVVLVDELIDLHEHMLSIKSMLHRVKYAYVTIDGRSTAPLKTDPLQLNMFDKE